MRKAEYRDRITISENILKTLNGSNKKKSRIMYEAFLTTRELKEHMRILIENDLVKYNVEDNSYSVTPKGVSFLSILKSMNEYLKEIDNNAEGA
jgi:predicted transcriptional regulator